MSKIKLADLSTEELEQALAKRKAAEVAALEKERKLYEARRETLISAASTMAKDLSDQLTQFKADVFKGVTAFYEQMKEYGDVKTSNKGNFSILSEDKRFKMEVTRNKQFGFDERGNQAEELIKEFLEDKTKKGDKEAYQLISTLLEREQKSGKFDPRNIHKLYQYEHKFKDDRFARAIKLFKEAYTEQKTCQYVRFYEMNENGKYEAIALNFSSI